jgi:hypothetical protein
MNPIRYEDGTAVFTKSQVDNYGMPYYFGYDDYIVLDNGEPEYLLDWKAMAERDYRPIHRYSRIARFKTVLLNILGDRSNVPDQIITIVKTYLGQSNDPWNDTRRILKSMKQQRYYNSISTILQRAGYARNLPRLSSKEIEGIMNDYMLVNDRFQKHKHNYNRKYFPNMKFVVLKILAIRGYKPKYKIPLARTERKLMALEQLWNDLFCFQ